MRFFFLLGCVHDCNITNEGKQFFTTRWLPMLVKIMFNKKIFVILDQTDLGCPPILNQVCGDDNQIYANECILNKQNVIFGGNAVKLMHDGACQGKFLYLLKLSCSYT